MRAESINIGKKISDILGLKHVKKLDIHMANDKRTTVEAVMYPEIDGVKQLPVILKKFELRAKTVEVTTLGEKYKNYIVDEEAAE